MNYIDLIVIAVLGISVMMYAKRGLILAAFDLVSWVIALMLTYTLYPIVSRMLLNTAVYTSIRETISSRLNMSEGVQDLTIWAQNEIITSLPIPQFLQDMILQHNNPAIYQMLDVSSLEEFIASYIANIAINIMACIIVLILVLIGLRFIASTLNIISKLPIINSMNKIGGAVVGIFIGTIFIWIIFLGVSLLALHENHYAILLAVDESGIGSWFYQNNVILNFILTIVD